MKLKHNQRIVFVSGNKQLTGKILEFDGQGRPFVEVVHEKSTKKKGVPVLTRSVEHFKPELRDILEVL